MLRLARSRPGRSGLRGRRPLWPLLPVLAAAACRTAAPPAPPASPATATATAPAAAVRAATPDLVLGPIDPAWVTSGGGATSARPGAPARAVLEVRFAPVARVLADINVLGRKLPMRLGDLVTDAIGRKTADGLLPIDDALLGALAPDRSIALVVAHVPGSADGPLCIAVPFSRPADAVATERKLGTSISSRAGATERRSASGDRLWTGVKDGALLLSDSYAGLVATCAQALAATLGPAPAEDAVATVDMQALLATRGPKRDLETELGDNLARAADEAAAKAQRAAKPGSKTDAAAARLSRESMRSLGRRMGKAIAQSARARLAISVSPGDGLLLNATLEPGPGATPSQNDHAGFGFALDPALPIDDDRATVFAWRSLGWLEPVLRAAVPAGEAAAGANKSMIDEFLAAFTGAGSCVLDNQAPLSSVCSLPLRAGVDARQALDRYAAFMRAMVKLSPQAGGRAFSPRIKKDVLEFEWQVNLGAVPPEQAAMMRAYVGGGVTRYAVTVRGGRLLQFQGPTARARLLAWKDVAPGAPAPARPALLEQTLARTRGAAFMMWIDPLALVLRMLEHATDPSMRQARIMLSALPGLATTRTPIVVDARGSPGLDVELRVPMATFDNVATLIGPFMGLMGR